MKNTRPKFVVDPYRFNGSFFTSMADGIHCDYTHKTLEELRAGENNPALAAVSRNTADKMFRIHLESRCLPFKEITEEEYYENMDILPPVRHSKNFFFIGEPYFKDLYTFCFHVDGRYFTGLRSVTTPRKELERQMEGHYRSLTFKGRVTREQTCTLTDKEGKACLLTPYFFTGTNGEKKFICNLVTGPDETPDILKARKNMAEILLSLRRHHFLYFSEHKKQDDMENLLEEVRTKGYTLLANGKLFQYPMNRESVSFAGTVKETDEPFFFRIYDKDVFMHLLHVLRGVKREKAKI